MLVETIMKTEVMTLPPTATISDALERLQKNAIRHIPIMDENKQVIGIISDRDVRSASPSILSKDTDEDLLQQEIQTIMSDPVVTIHPLDFVEEIASIFYEEEFGCLPVVKNKQLVGIVTEKDMLYTLIQLTGTHVQSSHLEVKVPHQPGILLEVATVVGKRNINITSLLIYPYKDDPNYKTLVFRLQTMNPFPVIQDLREAGFELLWPNDDPEQSV